MRQRTFWIASLILLLLCACQPTAEDNDGNSEVVESTTSAPVVDTPIIPTATQTFLPVVETAASATAIPEPSVPPVSTPTAQPTAVASPTTPPTNPVEAISLLPVVTEGLTRPVYLTHAFDGRLFVVEQDGAIRIIENEQLLSEPFLDINERVDSDDYEQGLLSMAFHPNYATDEQPGTGIFYIYYTDNNGNTVVSHFQVSDDDPNRANADSETIILQVEQPYANHNGGLIKFGPDGYLYIGLGDGGSGGDPLGHGQNLATLLGSMLRIDVSQAGDSYEIPADNPFVNDRDARPEIWAYGLRNPWRFSFDRLTGDLYIADVGQAMWEEVSFQPGNSSGGENYGWNIMEGSVCYSAASCDHSGLTLPIFDYDHSKGCSITGGYVYRGRQFPELTGNYFTADYCSGIVWRLFPDPDGSGRWLEAEFPTTSLIIPSFGEDVNGELYIVAHSGAVYQIQPAN